MTQQASDKETGQCKKCSRVFDHKPQHCDNCGSSQIILYKPGGYSVLVGK